MSKNKKRKEKLNISLIFSLCFIYIFAFRLLFIYILFEVRKKRRIKENKKIQNINNEISRWTLIWKLQNDISSYQHSTHKLLQHMFPRVTSHSFLWMANNILGALNWMLLIISFCLMLKWNKFISKCHHLV